MPNSKARSLHTSVYEGVWLSYASYYRLKREGFQPYSVFYSRLKNSILSCNTLVFYDSRAPVRDCFAKLTAYAAQTGSTATISALRPNENCATDPATGISVFTAVM